MSLILEALKKLEREKDVPERGFLVMAPVEWRSSPRRLGLVLGFLAVGMAAAGGVALWWLRGTPPPRMAAPKVVSASVPAATQPPVAAKSSLPEPAPTPAAASAPSPAAPAPERPSERTAPIATRPLADRPAVAAIKDSKPVAPPVRPAGSSEEAAAPPPASADRGQKDTFQLQAISQRDGEPVAVINERLVREGDSFDGVRILKIGADHVEIEVRGHRRTVRF